MMSRALFFAVLSLVAVPAFAADRSYSVGSFERVRVEGPFEVRINTGGSPGARASGDAKLIEQLDIIVNGGTLVVRLGSRGWGETPTSSRITAPVVTLSTPRLIAASVVAGGRVTIGAMKAQRVDLAITGAGSLTVPAVDADQLNTTVIGTGVLTVGGRASRARLQTNGPGATDATALTVNDLTVRVEGSGETRATARYTAQVTSTGLGKVVVSGPAKCTVTASAGGPVECGERR